MSDHEVWELREAVRELRAEIDRLTDRLNPILEDLAERIEALEGAG